MKLWLCASTAGLSGLLIGIGLSGSSKTSAADEKIPPGTASAPLALAADNPIGRNLDASLYMQTSAEYRAACYQAYRLASLRLKEQLASDPKEALKPAIVMDLDETVLDNGGFQAMMIRSGLAYDQRLWDLWEEKHGDRVGLIPGAKEFILAAEAAGVQVCHISNRNDLYRAQTKKVLERLGIPVRDEMQLQLATEKTGSNKTSRRENVEKAYRVVLYVGDNLRDFDEKFRMEKFDPAKPETIASGIEGRKKAVDGDRESFGTKWIILPNPAYGEWNKPMGKGSGDFQWLAPEKKR